MSDPYRIVGVDAESADDESIRRAYLEGLRVHSPEQNPAGFERLRDAYDQISSHQRRLAHAMFHTEMPDADALAEQMLAPGASRRPGADALRAALAAGLKPR